MPKDENVDGTAVGYTHGAPVAPKNFAASSVPGGVALTWDAIMKDHGIIRYQYAYKMKSDGKPDWKTAATSGAQVVTDVDHGEHTFMLRAVGRSDNDTSTMGDIPGVAAVRDGHGSNADTDPSGGRGVAPRDAPLGQRRVSAPAPAVWRLNPRVED